MGVVAMLKISSFGAASIATLLVSAEAAWAGCAVPAPLIGVSGPYGIVAAGLGYGGYLLFKRYRG
jgi:hypothetical protein